MTQHDDDSGNDGYEIGYGKPPKHTQFQPGQSGNAKGRPKGSRNFKTDVLATLKTPIPVTQDGKKSTISTQLAILMRLREKALSGDGRALDRLLELAGEYNNEELTTIKAARSADDQAILDAFVARTQSTASSAVDGIETEGENTDERD